MFYAEFPPSPQLSCFIQTIWIFESASDASASEAQRIVPDGHAELILHYGDIFHEIPDSVEEDVQATRLRQSRLLFAGQMSRPLILQPGVVCGVIGVRFRPAGARALIGIAMHETTDTRLNMIDVWGHDGDLLLDQVHSQRSPKARIGVVEAFLARKFAAVRIAPDALVTGCVDLLQQSAGLVTIDALAAVANLSGRQLERRFLIHVGIPPRLLASIFRFRRVFASIEQGAAPSARWTQAALSTGYFDQAHMNRDFKRFAGVSPQAFYRGLGGLAAAMLNGDDQI